MNGSSMKSHSEGLVFTRNLILRGMTAVYLVAFLSFYYESPGLFGNNGVLPARIQIEGISINTIHKKPTLLHFSKYLGLDTEYMIDVLALLGSLISFTGLLSQKMCILPIFTAMWSLYFSLIQIAQAFTNQSDYVLLEVGIILIIMAPFNSKKPSPTDGISFILLRWFLIRFMFESGSVKLGSYCPYWWSFTGMSRHFETMPLPTSLSWYAHNLPPSWLKVTNIFTNATELIGVWCFFFPHRRIRRYAFYWQLFLQLNIVLTGNYGFLNYMIMVLLLSLLDDQFLLENGKRVYLYDMFKLGVYYAIRTKWFFIAKIMIILFVIFIVVCYLFGNTFETFTFKEDYMELLRNTIKPAPFMALVLLIATFLNDIISHSTMSYAQTIAQKLYAINTLIAFSIISGALIIVSMLGRIYEEVSKYHIVNEYGQHLRKMRADRVEIIYEYSQSIDGPWQEYGFQYKPWNVNQSLPFTGFYFARFDQQFYEATATSYRNQLWTVSVAYRLLQNEPNTLQLFHSRSSNINLAPKFVRASIFKFSFTSNFNSRINWKRKRLGEYIPPLSLDSGHLLSHLKSIKISPNYKVPLVTNQFLKKILDFIRYQVHLIEGNILIFTIVAAAIIINLTMKRRH